MAKPKSIRSLLSGLEPRRKHSPLYEAMAAEYEAMAASFAKGPPRWAALTEGFHRLGILDGDGKPPTLRTAQQTWYRVRADRERETARAAQASLPSPTPSAPRQAALPMPLFAATPVPVAPAPDPEEAAAPAFRFATRAKPPEET